MLPFSNHRKIPAWKQVLNLTVLVSALGYFVDMFDLLLFPIVRQPSLAALGIPPGEAQIVTGSFLLNLEPATIRGVPSQGMILAAGDAQILGLSALDHDVPAGTRVR